MKGDGSPFDFAPRPGAWNGQSCGVLCIHGFSGTPFEMRFLGEHLGELGFRAVGRPLVGHSTSPEELDQTSWQDWYAGVESAFDELRATCDRVAVVGQSLGGLLALHLARHRGAQLAGVATLGAPLTLFRLPRAVIRASRPGAPLSRWLRALPKLGGSDIRDPVMRRTNPCYPVIPLRALGQLWDFMAVVASELELVGVPTLVMHGRRDHAAPYASSVEIARRVRAPLVRHRPLERSYHLVTIDVERNVVAAEVGQFFGRCFRQAYAHAKTPGRAS